MCCCEAAGQNEGECVLTPRLGLPGMSAVGPLQAPRPSALAPGRWGTSVAGVMGLTAEGRATPRPASAIEARSAVTVPKLDDAV
jgi:hypothetical protein